MSYRLKVPIVNAVQFLRTSESLTIIKETIKPYVLEPFDLNDVSKKSINVFECFQDGSVFKYNPVVLLEENDWVIVSHDANLSQTIEVISNNSFILKYEPVL